MDIFITIIIAGFASGYVVEAVSPLFEFWFDPRTVKRFITPPISLVALLLLGVNGPELFVYVPASGFVSLIVLWWVSRPMQIQQVVGGRR